jgi:hypothetical protein
MGTTVFKDQRLHSFSRFFEDSLCRWNVYTGKDIYFLFVLPTQSLGFLVYWMQRLLFSVKDIQDYS